MSMSMDYMKAQYAAVGRGKLASLGCTMLIAGVMSIAVSSIGIQCYDENKKTKEKRGHNYKFIIANLILAILMVLLSFGVFYGAAKS